MKYTNAFFQLDIRPDGVYLHLYPPVDNGKQLSVQELVNYLDGCGLKDIDLKVINNANISGYEIEAPVKTGSGKASQTITLTPSNVATNDSAYNTGLLSVLRDYKHYYKLGVSRDLTETEVAFVSSDAENRTIEASWCDADGTTDIEPLYTYRNITNAELAKAAMLAMTYGFFKASGGAADYSNTGSCYVKQEGSDTAGGTFSNTKGHYQAVGSMIGKYHHTFIISNSNSGQGYAPAMLTPAGTQNSVVAIYTTKEYKFWDKGAEGGFLKFEDSPVLNVTAANSEVGNIYNATITVTCSSSSNLGLSVQRSYSSVEWSYSASSSAARREYFPIQFTTDRNWDFKNSSYGWWGKKQ